MAYQKTMMNRFIAYGVLLLVYSSVLLHATEFKIVTTPTGPIKGILVDVPSFNTSVYQYKGIPFAQPPVGNLRFRKPIPAEPWNDTFDAFTFGNACLQMPDPQRYPNTSEDCLTLNVYVPKNTTTKDSKAVMIFIHGGGFVFGGSSDFDGSFLPSVGDIILVTINYRLGVFGFLATMDSSSLGNYGLWDQQMAIKWIKENIPSFGGDSESVTIFGESAGGYSVSLQALHSENKGLFQSVIAQSGVANSKIALTTLESAHKTALKIANESGCNNGIPPAMIDCLRRTSANVILQSYINDSLEIDKGRLKTTKKYGPVVDGDFLKDDPEILLNDQSSDANSFYRSLNMVIGVVDAEGSLVFLYTRQYENRFNFTFDQGIPTEFLCKAFAPSIAEDYFSNNSKVAKAICDFYKIPDTTSTGLMDQGRKVVDLMGDFFFVYPSLISLDSHISKYATYQYVFSMPDPIEFFGLPYPTWFKGAWHAADISYLFFDLRGFPNEHFQLSVNMMKYWTNIAKTGNPNGNNTSVFWPPYTATKQEYLDLSHPITQKDHVFKERMEFWRRAIPDIINKKSVTDGVGRPVPCVVLTFVFSFLKLITFYIQLKL